MRQERRFALAVIVTATLACCLSLLVAQADACCLRGTAMALPESRVSGDGIIVSDVAPYWTPTGSVIVVGFVANLNPDPVTDVRVSVSLIGRDREDLATTEAALVPRVLPPGARAPWRAEIPDAPWQQGARARASALPLDPETVALPMPSLHVDDVVIHAITGKYMSGLVGRVTNVGAETAANVRVLVALIAVDGRPAEVDEARPAVDELQPGQSAPFAIESRLGTLPNVADFRAFPEATVRP